MELTKRVISAAVMILICLAAIWLGGWFLAGLASVVGVLMMLDVSNALKSGGYRVNRIILLACAILLPVALYFFGMTGYALVCCAALVACAICMIFASTPDFKSFFAEIFALVYPLLPAAVLIQVSMYDMRTLSRNGTILVISAVACACISDAFAYFGGRLFGKKKLCPQISPKKTIAGSISSFVGGTLCSTVLFFLFNTSVQLGAVAWIITGFLCGGLAQIGDLTASMLKRFCNIKDYGKYIPGHGGIMDRMDSISLCLIPIALFAEIFIEGVL